MEAYSLSLLLYNSYPTLHVDEVGGFDFDFGDIDPGIEIDLDNDNNVDSTLTFTLH